MKYFLPFILLFNIVLIISVVMNALATLNRDKTYDNYFNVFKLQNFTEDQHFAFFVILWICSGIMLLFGILLVKLVTTQFFNIFTGMTTFERFGFRQKTAQKSIRNTKENSHDAEYQAENLSRSMPGVMLPVVKESKNKLIKESLNLSKLRLLKLGNPK